MRYSRRNARSSSLYTLDALDPRLLLAASKVVFTTSPVNMPAGSTSPAITVQLQDAGGVPAVAGAGGQVVNLSTSSKGGAFLDPGDNVISSVLIPAGASSATFEYTDVVATTPVLAASSTGLASATQQQTITATAATQLAFTTLPAGSMTSTNSTTITVTLRDAAGNVAVAPVGGTVVGLSSNSAGGTFSTGASVTIAAGSSVGSFTYRDTLVGTPTITASAAGLSPALQQQTIYSATTVVVKPDPAGLGSYASTPPGGQNAPTVYGTQYDWINRPANSPLPTNDWWTLILKGGFAGSLYSMPQKLFTASNGVTVSGFTGINSVANNIGYSGEQTILVGASTGTFTRDAMVDYGDWSVRFRMERAANQYIDVTTVQGSPMAWYEYNNLAPKLTLGTAGSYGTIFDGAGASLGNGSSGFTADRFRFAKGGVNFGVFAPAGTVFVPTTDGFTAAFAGSNHFLVVATLPNSSNTTFNDFYQHAYAVPRNTTYGFSYVAADGELDTTWNITTELLKPGASTDILQGWLPANYRDIGSGPALLAAYTYPTIYGPIKLSLGSSFTITQPTNGLNFALPAPQQIGGAADFDPAKMAGWLNTYQLGTGADSYGGQTTLSQAAQLTLMAQQLNDPNYTRLLNILRGGVTNWLTYQAGDTKFYTYYPKDKALIAYPPAFGSEHYTDLHFHLGYLTSSAAVLAMLDPSWAANYGAMATMVARSYANWDRADTSEPYLRTFNPWRGHSYADGLGDSLGNQGNNQESVSEAVQSWQGLALLGQALNNPAMTEAGMMGYILESKSELEYWLNVAHQDLNPPGYPVNRNTAINADFTRQQQTFFGNQPKYQLGIVGLPNWPSMDFLGKYNPAMQAVIDATMTAIGGADPYQTLGNSDDGNNWLAVILGMQGQVNPQKAADQFARLQTLNAADNINPVSGIPYYLSHSNRTIGLRDWNFHLSLPVGGVYTNASTGKKTYVVYNPEQSSQTVQVFNAAGAVVDSFIAAARTITTFSAFASIDGTGTLQLNGTPAADTFSISQSGDVITASLGTSIQTFDANAVTTVVVAGLASNDTLNFNGPITRPVAFNAGAGNNTLNVNAGTFSFAGDAALTSDNLTINVAAGALVIFNASQHLAGLNVAGDAILPAGGNRLIFTRTASFTGGTLDLCDNTMIVENASGALTASVRAALASGYSGGSWTGAGIRSSSAAATLNRTLGSAIGTDLFGSFPASFAGEPVGPQSILICYTLPGDGTLDRAVNLDDFTRFAASFSLENVGFGRGDFNYDGFVTLNDFTILASQFGQSFPAAPPSARTATTAAPALVRASTFAAGRIGQDVFADGDLTA